MSHHAAADLVLGIIPALSSADLLDVVSRVLNELDFRGDDIELRRGSILSQWAEISLSADDAKGYTAVFHDHSIAEQAAETFRAGGAA